MYIPTQFFGQSSCVQLAFTGSKLPDSVTLGQAGSGDDLYFYVQVLNGEATFDIIGGNANAKLLLIGGGGFSENYFANSTGGGGAGEVIYEDIAMAPGRYFISASAGGISTDKDGRPSELIVNYDKSGSEQQQYIARGGITNNEDDGGASGNGNAGGSGVGATAAGGGGGSNGVGQDAVGGGTPDGGDGGDGTTIDAPFSDVVLVGGTKVAGGGPGKGQSTDGSYASGVIPAAYGNGGSGAESDDDGRIGAAFLFIPLANCQTGSYTSEFKAEGGNTVDTFISGGVQYKYHIWTDASQPGNTDRNLFKVTQGFTTEGQMMAIGGGAGSAVSGSTPSQNGYRNGGAGAGGVIIKDNVTLWGYNNVVEVGRGGRGDYISAGLQAGNTTSFNAYELNPFTSSQAVGGNRGATETSNAGGSESSGGGGAGWNTRTAAGVNTAGKENIANDGGIGKHNALNTNGSGGGGGGAGSAGSDSPAQFSAGGAGGDGFDFTNTHFSFLTGSFASGKVGYGGAVGLNNSFPPESGSNHVGVVNDVSGANPKTYESGSDGFMCIVYPISGTVENSQI